MEVVIHKRMEILEKLVPKLEGFIDRYHESTIFHDVIWLKNWWKHKEINKEVTPYIVEIKKGNKMKGIIPMYIIHQTFAKSQFRILKPMGTGVFNSLTPILSKEYCPQELLEIAFDKIYEDKYSWDSIHWAGLPEESNLDLYLKERKGKYVKGKNLVISPRVKLNKDVNIFHKQLSKSFLKGIFYNKRKLKREGELQYNLVEKEEQLEPIMDNFFEFHCSRWKFSVYRCFQERRLLIKTLKSFLDRGLLHLSYLSHNGEVTAVELGLLDGKTRYMYMGAMNPSFHKYSVGHILMYKVIKEACVQGFEEVDFFGGTEEYKQKWGPINGNILEYKLFNNSKKSFLCRQIHETYYCKQFTQRPPSQQFIAKLFIRGYALILETISNVRGNMKSSTP